MIKLHLLMLSVALLRAASGQEPARAVEPIDSLSIERTRPGGPTNPLPSLTSRTTPRTTNAPPAPSTNTNSTATTNTSAANLEEPGEAITNAAPYEIPENRIIQFMVPLSPAAKAAVAHSKNPPVEYARAAIAVPARFEPEIPSPILLVTGTSDGDASSIRAMHAFTNIALRLGWVVIAADGPLGKPANDSPPWRWAMVSSLLDHMHKNWEGSKRWPIACAGYSGGGKWAGVMGAILARQNYNLVGVFMAAVNEDYASEAAKLYEPAVKYKQVPIYLSSGTDDKLATPQHHSLVKENLLHNGFNTVRLETFKGGHALSEDELRTGLKWFLEEYTKSAL